MDRKILHGIREDLQYIKKRDPTLYHYLEEKPLRATASRIHREALRLHPPGCNCPFHGGHPQARPKAMKGIGKPRSPRPFVKGSYGPGGKRLNVQTTPRHRRFFRE